MKLGYGFGLDFISSMISTAKEWILALGVWDDSGAWIDSETWNDS